MMRISTSLCDLTTPQVMGIINITDNSFCSRNRTLDPQHALDIALTMQEDGAVIIDVGAEATNPSIDLPVTAQQELDRLLPVLELLQKHLAIPFSVDTSQAEVILAAAQYGMALINDVRALILPGALEAAVDVALPVCLMHNRYACDVSHRSNAQDIVSEVKKFLEERIRICIAAGLSRENIIIDPGFGAGNFGKNCKENLQLLSRLREFQFLQMPILVGLSRKTFIGEILGGASSQERLYGSIAAAVIAVINGARIIRTHDVKETKDAMRVAIEIMQVEESNG